MKLSKGKSVITLLMDHWSISPLQLQTAKVLAMLVLYIHILSCFWWLWKAAGMGEEDVQAFLDNQSWATSKPPPLLSTADGKIEAYLISVYVTTMTLTTVGYGDISADNSMERLGYVLLFIVGAFVWGNLLAEVGEIHSSASEREREKTAKVQKTLGFLVDHHCPPKLRHNIISWTSFHEEHNDDNLLKKKMIDELPPALQRGLVRHLYGRYVSLVPIFAYIERSEDGDKTNDEIQEAFLNEIFLQLAYKTYTPGEVLINFSDPPDELLIIVDGKVQVEFEHPSVQRHSIVLKEGDFIGDMGLVGEEDWAMTTCFNFPPAQVDAYPERTEIKVCTHSTSFVVVLELTREAFQDTLAASSVVTKGAVDEFVNKWKKTRAAACEDPAGAYSMEQLLRWDHFASKFKKKARHDKALEENTQWKFAKSQKSAKQLTKEPAASSPHASPYGVGGDSAQLQLDLKLLESRMDTRMQQMEARLEGLLKQLLRAGGAGSPVPQTPDQLLAAVEDA